MSGHEAGAYTIIISIPSSTFFLVGPISQAKKLCDPNQLIGMAVKIGAIIVVIIMVALVFCSVFWVGIHV